MDETAAVEPGKIFVGGLAWGTTKDSLKAHFEEFGNVSDCVVMAAPDGKPRCFGFVTFSNPEHVTVALEIPEHYIDGKKVDPKRATQKGQQQEKHKLFLGGIPQSIPKEVLAGFINSLLEQKGLGSNKVVNVDIKMAEKMPDPGVPLQNKGYAFVELANEQCLDKILEKNFYTINNKQVEFKRAVPQHTNTGFQHGKGRGGGGTQEPYPYRTGHYATPYAYPTYTASGYPSYQHPPQQQYSYPYGGRGYAGQQQMSGGYMNDTAAAYSQGGSSYSDAGYNTSMMGYQSQFQYGGTGGEPPQPSSNSPASYPRTSGGMTGQARGGMSHGGYPGYGNH